MYLRLADLLERRGEVDNLRDALECASAAVTALDAARDDGAANAMAEDVSGALAARGNLSEAVFFSEGTAVPSEAGLTKSANVSDAKDPGTFAFVPADVPESAKRLACLHADAVAKTAHLRCKARLAAMGVAADRGVRALPAELREELNAVAADNKWEAAAARTESALFTRRVSVRDASLAEAADLMEQAERAERRAFLRGAPSSAASEKRLLTPDAPVVLGATSGSVTLLPPTSRACATRCAARARLRWRRISRWSACPSARGSRRRCATTASPEPGSGAKSKIAKAASARP